MPVEEKQMMSSFLVIKIHNNQTSSVWNCLSFPWMPDARFQEAICQSGVFWFRLLRFLHFIEQPKDSRFRMWI